MMMMMMMLYAFECKIHGLSHHPDLKAMWRGRPTFHLSRSCPSYQTKLVCILSGRVFLRFHPLTFSRWKQPLKYSNMTTVKDPKNSSFWWRYFVQVCTWKHSAVWIRKWLPGWIEVLKYSTKKAWEVTCLKLLKPNLSGSFLFVEKKAVKAEWKLEKYTTEKKPSKWPEDSVSQTGSRPRKWRSWKLWCFDYWESTKNLEWSKNILLICLDGTRNFHLFHLSP